MTKGKIKEYLTDRLACLTTVMVMVISSVSMISYAEEIPATIEQVSILTQAEKDTIPAYMICQGETEYILQEWRLEERVMPERREPVLKTVIAKDMEYLNEVLPEILVEVGDDKSGQVKQVLCRLTKTTVISERWEDDFAVPILFHSYPSEAYYLGNVLMTEEQLMNEVQVWQNDILEYLNLPQTDYQIEQMTWDGEFYINEQGESCRSAKAYGKRYLKDYQLVYEGEALFETYESYQLTALYALDHALTESVAMESGKEPGVSDETTKASEPETFLSPKTEVIVQNETRPVLLIRIGIGFLLFVLAALLWFVTGLKKKNKKLALKP